MLTEAEAAERMDAYYTTGTDKDAAEKLHMSPASFSAWRRKEGLASKLTGKSNIRGGARKMLSDITIARRLKMYEEGFTDSAIGKALNIKPGAVSSWRGINGLPKNEPPALPVHDPKGFREVRVCKGPCRENFICRDPKHVKCEFCQALT